MIDALRRPAAGVRGPAWALAVLAFFVGAVGASVLFVGVWRNEASRAKSADAQAQDTAAVLKSTTADLRDTQLRLRVAQERLRRAEATVDDQAALLEKLAAAGKPIARDAAALQSASQALASDGAGLGDSVAKLTNAVAALGVYLKQTSPSQLDPAYLDAQLSYLRQSLGSLESRSKRLHGGAASVADARAALKEDIAVLQDLARRARG